MRKTNLSRPKISVVIATFNSEKTIDRCLRSIRDQKYPQNNIEILLVDGASKDKTLEIAKKYHVKVLSIPANKQNAEYNKGVGVRAAKGQLLLMIDHDNILPHECWLSLMVEPILRHQDVVGVETLRYHYDRHASLLDRYAALFGAVDPVAFYLGKADRLSLMYDSYNLYGKAQDFGKYYIVEFSPDKIPTLGANGFLVRRKILMENAKVDETNYFHIDVNVDLIRKGFNKYAFIKDDIIHLTGYKNIGSFLMRRKLFIEQFYFKTQKHRRYSVYMANDTPRLFLFALFALTGIKPTIDAIRGYIKIHDIAWFLHPILAMTLFFIYSYVTIKTVIKRYASR